MMISLGKMSVCMLHRELLRNVVPKEGIPTRRGIPNRRPLHLLVFTYFPYSSLQCSFQNPEDRESFPFLSFVHVVSSFAVLVFETQTHLSSLPFF